MLRNDDDAVYVIDWPPVPSLRRSEHKIPHRFHECAAVARIPDRGSHLNPCHTPVRPNPEPDLVLSLFFGRRPRGDSWHQQRRGPEDITRAATRARTRIRAGPGPAARPGSPARPRSLSRATRRSIARPHNRGGRGRGRQRHDEGGGGDVDLRRFRDWGNRRNRDGVRRRDVFRSRGRCWDRESEPADRRPAAAATTARTATAATAVCEQSRAAPQHENGDGDVHDERERSGGPLTPPRARQRVLIEDGPGPSRWRGRHA